MSRIEGYVVLNSAGKLKRPRYSAPGFFLKRSTAQAVANNEGDSVVPVYVDLEQQPVFIRGKKL